MGSDELAKWIFLPALAVVVVVLLASKFEPPRFVRAWRRKRHIARARKMLASPAAVVYWDRCRYLSRSEITALAKEYGKRYVNYEIRETGWALNFTTA